MNVTTRTSVHVRMELEGAERFTHDAPGAPMYLVDRVSFTVTGDGVGVRGVTVSGKRSRDGIRVAGQILQKDIKSHLPARLVGDIEAIIRQQQLVNLITGSAARK